MQGYTVGPRLIPGRWFEYEIDVRGDDYTVDLTDLQTGNSQRTTTFKDTDMFRGKPSGYIGLQAYNASPVAFRHIQIKG
jgi:hypothetical protein